MDNKIKVHWLVFVCLQLHTNQGSPGSDCLDFGPLVFFCCESSSSSSLWKMDAGLSNLAQNATFSPFVKASLFLPSAAHTVHISICQQVAILWSYNNKWSLQQTSPGTDWGFFFLQGNCVKANSIFTTQHQSQKYFCSFVVTPKWMKKARHTCCFLNYPCHIRLTAPFISLKSLKGLRAKSCLQQGRNAVLLLFVLKKSLETLWYNPT